MADGRQVTESEITAAVQAALRSGDRREKWAGHEWIRSGWTIVAACIAVGTLLFNVGQFVARVERPREVKVAVPAHIQQELAACRALALVVTGASKRRGDNR